jgi:hypothetical protein
MTVTIDGTAGISAPALTNVVSINSATANTPVLLKDIGTNTASIYAWCSFNGSSSTPIAPAASFNVSSITKNSTGNYTVNCAIALPDANYGVSFSSTGNSGLVYVQPNGTTKTSSTVSFIVQNSSGTSYDGTSVSALLYR